MGNLIIDILTALVIAVAVVLIIGSLIEISVIWLMLSCFVVGFVVGALRPERKKDDTDV